MKNILTYTEYKIENAIWLQIQLEKRTEFGFTPEQFYLNKYFLYLSICGNFTNVLHTKIYKQIFIRINNCGIHREYFSNTVFDNVNELTDEIVVDFIKTIKKQKVLPKIQTFSEYRINNALYLQQTLHKTSLDKKNYNMFFFYRVYLNICNCFDVKEKLSEFDFYLFDDESKNKIAFSKIDEVVNQYNEQNKL